MKAEDGKTTYGVKRNIYSDILQSQVTMEQLFTPDNNPL